jgi:hypothetical protein
VTAVAKAAEADVVARGQREAACGGVS